MQLLQYVERLGIPGNRVKRIKLLELPLTLGGITYVDRTKMHDLCVSCTRTYTWNENVILRDFSGRTSKKKVFDPGHFLTIIVDNNHLIAGPICILDHHTHNNSTERATLELKQHT